MTIIDESLVNLVIYHRGAFILICINKRGESAVDVESSVECVIIIYRYRLVVVSIDSA